MIVRDAFILCASKRLNGQSFYVAQILKDCDADIYIYIHGREVYRNFNFSGRA